MIIKNDRWSPHNEQRWEELFLAFGRPAITIDKAKEITSDIGTNANIRRSSQSEWEQAAIDKFRAVNDMRDDPFSFPTTSEPTSSSGTGEGMSSLSQPTDNTGSTSTSSTSSTMSSSFDSGTTIKVSVFFVPSFVAIVLVSFIIYTLKKKIKKIS